MVLIEGPCTHASGLLRRSCRAAAVGACVYCGERFCEAHGDRGEDYIEVCHRKSCREKWHDVRRHEAWRARAAMANAVATCAHEGCEERMEHRCQRCRLMCCREHLRPKTIMDRTTDPPQRMSVMLCPHCAARRELWD